MSDQKPTPEEIEADIARQREELGATIGELHQRLDVKTHAKDAVGQARSDPRVLGGAAVAALLLVGVMVWRVRARRQGGHR